MKITRTSPFTGKTVTKEIEVTPAQIQSYNDGAFIQHAFPNLTPGEREFIKTGITDEEWDEFLPPEEE